MDETAPRKSRYREADIELLLPAFAERVAQLLSGLRAAGYQPVLFEGMRSPERAKQLAQKGAGIADSVHCYGAAADIICGEHGWDCKKSGCDFFVALGPAAERRGMVWGGRWHRVDLPHVQGISVADQCRMRALGRGGDSAGARDALVREHFARRP